MLLFSVFGIDNDGLNTAVNVLLLVLVVLWLALVIWTFADARRRLDDFVLVGCATVASLLFPFVGTIVYLILRPPEFMDDVRLRELEMQAAEARLVALDYQGCPSCGYEVRADYLRCPNCRTKLKERCYSCGKPLDADWHLCPYCEAEVGAPAPQASSGARRRRYASGAGEQAAAGASAASEVQPGPPR